MVLFNDMRSKVIEFDHVGGIEGIQKILDDNPTWRFVGSGCTKHSETYEYGGVGGRPRVLCSEKAKKINYAVFETNEDVEFGEV